MKNIKKKVSDMVYFHISKQVWDGVWSQVFFQVYNEVKDQVKDKVKLDQVMNLRYQVNLEISNEK